MLLTRRRLIFDAAAHATFFVAAACVVAAPRCRRCPPLFCRANRFFRGAMFAHLFDDCQRATRFAATPFVLPHARFERDGAAR